jgi:imidazolonepropionase-like amidohydrolase
MTRPTIRPRLLLDGDGTAFPSGTVVIVEDGRIASIAPDASVPASPLDEVIDGTLMPGLIDLHGYLSVDPDRPDPMRRMFDADLEGRAATARAHMARDLASGVTTVRVMGEGTGLDLALRAEVERDPTLGPTLFVCGAPIAPTGSHQAPPDGGVDAPAAIAAAIAARAAAGVDWIKLVLTGGMNAPGDAGRTMLYPPEAVRAAVDAARRAGLPIAVAAHGGPAVVAAVALGADTIEHCALAEGEASAALLSGPSVPVLTLSRFFSPAGIAKSAAGAPDILSRLADSKGLQAALVAALAASGRPFGLGTDNMHGRIAEDAALAAGFGLAPERILAALTGDAARFLRREGEIGVVRQGAQASLVALDGDPRADLSALGRVTRVWHRGHVVRIT